jgi:decaprenyl-phosphate phosphoribosyltransferase
MLSGVLVPQVSGASTPWMMLTLPFVVYGIFRYQLLSDPLEISRRSDSSIEKGGRTERPEEVLLKDLPTLLTVISWVLTTFVILLLKQWGVIQ